MKKKIWFQVAAAILCLIVAVFCFAQVFQIMREYRFGKDSYNRVTERGIAGIAQTKDGKTDYLAVNHAKLIAQNPDYAGWLETPGTGISYPLVRGADNDEYLRTTFEGGYALAGSIFLDYRNNPGFGDANTVIYGHHMKDGSMFAALKQYMTEDYAKEHTEIRIYAPDGRILIYNIFAAYKTDIEADCFTFGFVDDAERVAWVESMQEQSLFDFGGQVQNVDLTTITLVTCVGGNNPYRYVVQASLIQTVANER